MNKAVNKVAASEEETKTIYNPVTQEEIPTHQFAVRLTAEEQPRYARMIEIALSRNPLARKSDINRELMGLRQYGLFTKQEIESFRGMPESPTLLANIPEAPKPRRSKEAERATTSVKGHKGKK